jgi:hypothetical protein
VVKPVREGQLGRRRRSRRDERRVRRRRSRRAGCFDHELLGRALLSPARRSRWRSSATAPLGAVEIAPIGAKAGFYDYGAKYTRGATEYFVPPRHVARALPRRAGPRPCARTAALGCRRRDAGRPHRQRRPATRYILEVNTVPGLTQTSLCCRRSRHAAGIAFDELCEAQLYAAALPSHRPRGERRIAQRGFDGDERRAATAVPH